MGHQDCSLKSTNLNHTSAFLFLEIGSDKWSFIPHHLILCSLLTCISLPLYCLFRWVAGRRAGPRKDSSPSPPSLFSLVWGKSDDWVKKEKGRAAFNYINFQRMLLFMALVSLVISSVSLITNYTGHQSKDSPFAKTTITNLSDNSLLHWFNIITSFILPWLVVMVVKQFMVSRDKIASPSNEDSRTLVIEGLDPVTFSNAAIEEYFANNYPNFQLVKITRAQDTRYLRRKIKSLDWTTAVIQDMLSMGEDRADATCCGKEWSLAAFGRKQLEIKKIIDQEQKRLRSKTDFLTIIFLTFDSTKQAQKVVLIEQLDHFSYYNTIQQAPRPKDIAWENMRSPVLSLLIRIFSYVLFLLMTAFALYPAKFALKVIDIMDEELKLKSTLKSVAQTTIFLGFGQLMRYAVKLSLVIFGHWSKTNLLSSYMTTLFFMLILTIIIFPTVMLRIFSW